MQLARVSAEARFAPSQRCNLLLFGLTPVDFPLAAGACLLFALTLAARTWPEANEPRLVAQRRIAT